MGGRYSVLALLGRGGMGSVYRVRDESNGKSLALKRLTDHRGAAPSQTAIELFEREFHTLNQLAHPRVVRAFDYGIDGQRPFYTLELLGGGDLRERSPMPWQQVCTVAYELCSVLSLLHSRRLVHRDLTPRNVRLTTDGTAKLIDFGLLSPVGPVAQLAGTPPYLAPELVNHMAVDGRADLFALGATLYYALTGTLAYPVRTLAELWGAWRATPTRISILNPEVPAPLDRLIRALLRVDVDSRPRSAAEVMDRLRPLLAEAPSEGLIVAKAHLSAPTLVGRATEQARIRKQLLRSGRGRGGGFLITGEAGTGRSRMLDVFMLEAKLLGCIAARASGSDGAVGPLGVAHSLVKQLHTAAPVESLAVARRDPAVLQTLFDSTAATPDKGPALRDFTHGERDPATLQAPLRAWLLGICECRPVALAIDDLEMVDPLSMALLAAVAVEADRRHVSYAASVTSASLEQPAPALAMLAERARPMALRALDPEQATDLLRSVFGDVPNLQSAALQLHASCMGSPRGIMALAQHLVDHGIIRLTNGAWVLPPVIAPDALPASMEGALAQQIGLLSQPALRVARLLALSVVGHLSWAALEDLLSGPRAELQGAVDELRQAQLLTGGPGGYAGRTGARRIVLEGCTATDRASMHTALASMHTRRDAPPLVIAHHLLQGSDPQQGVRLMLAHVEDEARALALMETGNPVIGRAACAETFNLARAEAGRLGCPPGSQLALSLWLEVNATHGADLKYFYEGADEVTATLKRATGFHDWAALSHVTEPKTRALQAFGRATARHDATPEEERVRAPAQAIKSMVGHALQASAIGSRANDLELLASLPGLLEPFTPLSPAAKAMQRILIATQLTSVWANEAALEMAPELLAGLAEIDRSTMPAISYIRASAQLAADKRSTASGLTIDGAGVAKDTHVRSLQANVESVRRLAALQRGDWDAAEAHRKRAELLTLQNASEVMIEFLREEWPVHALLRDLTGMRSIRERAARLAKRHPGWVPEQLAIDAWYHRLCEQPEAALDAVGTLRDVASQAKITPPVFYRGVEVEVALLVEAGQPELALKRGAAALSECHASGRRILARGLALEVALAEATLGHHGAARARIDGEIAWQTELGVTGLQLGHSYEYLARVAIVSEDPEAFEAAAAAAAHEYRVAAGSMLAGRYRLLLEEAQQAGIGTGTLSAPQPATHPDDSASVASLLSSLPTDALAREGLALLCEVHGAPHGWLFLLTDTGLSLVASRGEPEDPKALANYAQAQLDLELDKDDVTMTQGGWTETQAGTAVSFELVPGQEGLRLEAIPLRAMIDSIDNLVGIAVMAAGNDDDARSYQFSELASGLARCLLDCGAYNAVQAKLLSPSSTLGHHPG